MSFAGDKKSGRSILASLEEKIKVWLLPKVPKQIETYHLTLATLIWSLLVIAFSFLARYNIKFLWLVSGIIICQYITDLLDGAIGRIRNTGLVKWGYYMDHFLDFLFLCAILIGYAFIIPDHYKYMLFFIMALFCGFMVNSFLSFMATNEFKIEYFGIGPTEIRLLFIIVNVLLSIFGRTYLAFSLPYVLFFSTLILFITVYKTQKKIWEIDMKEKEK